MVLVFTSAITYSSFSLLKGAQYTSKVAIFRQKNYSAEYETRRNRREFLRNSICFVEKKNLGIPFQTISGKRKTIQFQTISMIKPWNSFPNHFQKRKLRNSVPNHFRKKKNTEFHSELFSEEKTLKNPFQTIFGNRKHSKNDDFF